MAQARDDSDTRTVVKPVVTPPYVPPKPPAPVAKPIAAPVAPPPAPVTLPVTGGNVTNSTPRTSPTQYQTVAPPRTYMPTIVQSAPKPTYVTAPPANQYQTPAPAAQIARLQAQTAARPPALPSYSAQSYGNAPQGIDQRWWDEFTREHDGKTPDEVYRGDLDAALRDRAWGDQFYRTYGRPPSVYDWKASYYSRKYGPSGGGGGYGGGGGSYSNGNGASNLPAMWSTMFQNWYATNPQEQAANDYERFQQTWLARANTLPTTMQADNLLLLFAQHVQNVLGKNIGQATPAEFQAFLDRYLTQTPTPPAVAPINLGEF